MEEKLRRLREKFFRLLETERGTPEFAQLYTEVDEGLAACVADENAARVPEPLSLG